MRPDCSCPLCTPERWQPGTWVRDDKPLPKDEPIAMLFPVHHEGADAYYVRCAEEGSMP